MIEGHGTMSKKWLKELQEKVANCWEWHSRALQIGFRYAKPDQGDNERPRTFGASYSALCAELPKSLEKHLLFEIAGA